jgi:thioredoxin reductase (NADPH)
MSMYDTAIIGLGCAGYTTAIYSARYKLKTLIVGAQEGGMGMSAADVGNWPGDIEVRGPDLMERFKKHATSFDDVDMKNSKVEKIVKSGDAFKLILESGDEHEAKSIVFATGSNKRHLGLPGEEEFSGKGVTYCATCDAFFFRGKDVAVIGGGDSAVEGAAIAAQSCKTVYLIHRRNEFRAEPYWVDEMEKRDNIVMVLERNVTEILGDQKVAGVKLDKEFEGKDVLDVEGVFIEVGSDPASELAKDIGCELDDKGFVKVGGDQATSVSGVFAAGDVSDASNHFAQFATAAGEGAVAANSVFSYLQQ